MLNFILSRVTIIFLVSLLSACLTVTVTDGEITDIQQEDSADSTEQEVVAPNPLPQPEPTPTPEPAPFPEPPTNVQLSIAYNGWSTMLNTLEGQNTDSSTSPSPSHDPSLFNLVGEMYRANGLLGYSSDFSFLPQGSSYIDGETALENINTTTATVVVISAYGGNSGILQDTAIADSDSGWINKVVTAAQTAQSRGITPIMFQAWGSADSEGSYHNAKINTDALKAKKDMLVIRSAEVVEALHQLNPIYTNNTESPDGKYTIPVQHLYSGDTSDNFHGSYAMAYANALATFKALTGISAANNAFIIPSGGAAGDQYGMSSTFINDIIRTVDLIQKESLITYQPATIAPSADLIEMDATQGSDSLVNISSAANLQDDEAIILDNFILKTYDASHFSSIEMIQHQLSFTAANSYTGITQLVVGYTDAQGNTVDITITINVTGTESIESQEIIIGFGDGNWSSFGSSGSLYNHQVTSEGKVINGIRSFNAESTRENLQDSTGTVIGSITSLTSGNLAGLGFSANDTPVISHYGPYPELYDSLSAAPRGSSVSFSINGLDSSAEYRVNMAGRYVVHATNIVDVNVNGVTGQYDSSRATDNFSEFDAVAVTNQDGQLIVTLSSDGSSESSRWGLSYVHINRVTE